eukprot:jgi/Astpho2/9712/Aster-x1601
MHPVQGREAAAWSVDSALRPVADESQLVAELIKRVGPYADAALLERHLRAANGRLHWAVNSYFRDVCVARHAGQRDFEPRSSSHVIAVRTRGAAAAPSSKLKVPGGSQSDAAVLSENVAGVRAASTEAAGPGGCRQEQACLQQLPETLLESIMARTDVATVCQAASTCRTLHAMLPQH